MTWFNYYGLVIMAVIMTPNIVYAVKHKGGAESRYRNKAVEVIEQIGRYGCFVLMIFNIPYTYFNFWFNYGLAVYLSVNGVLCLAYIMFWIILWNKNNLLKALSLSVIPSVIFLFSGIVLADIPLIVFAVIFGASHILISCANNKKTEGKIRKAEAGDFDEIMQIWKEENIRAHNFIPQSYWEENYGAVKKALPNAEIFVYVSDGEILGFTGLNGNFIEGIFVKSLRQHGGIGSALLNELKTVKPCLTLNVYKKNVNAVRFYLKNNFCIIDESIDKSVNESEYSMQWRKES